METLIEKSCEFRGTLTETILSEGLEIPDFEDYKIFKEGFIISFKNPSKPIILKTGKGGYNRNYHHVTLCKNGKTYIKNLHRLVAEIFKPQKDLSMQVNHIDGNTDNNNINNLEWCTPRENSKHAVSTGLTLTGEFCPWATNSEKYIRSICEMLQDGKDNKDIRATLGNVSPKLLWKIRHRKQWKQISCEYNF